MSIDEDMSWFIPVPRSRSAGAPDSFRECPLHIGTAHGASDVVPTMRFAGGAGNTG